MIITLAYLDGYGVIGANVNLKENKIYLAGDLRLLGALTANRKIIMKKLFVRFLQHLTKKLEKEPEIILELEETKEEPPAIETPLVELQVGPLPKVEEIKKEEILSKNEAQQGEPQSTQPLKKKGAKKETVKPSRNKIVRELTPYVRDPRDIRDIMELMEVPFVALSKKRTEPIIYESPDGKVKVRVSCHPPHYVASIYDWDIIIFVSSKLQEMMNSGSDIPPRSLIIPRHELLKAIYKHDGKQNQKEIEASLSRLQLTGIETTIHNEDFRYRGGFGFLDSWGYTERKDVKEFRITLSEWLYTVTCNKGSLLKIPPEYFKITSGLKRFLYRTGRKHVGYKNESWIFSVEKLYEKSGSEQEFKKFKYDLKKAVKDNDVPSYFLEWIEKEGKSSVRFINQRKELKKMLSEEIVRKPF